MHKKFIMNRIFLLLILLMTFEKEAKCQYYVPFEADNLKKAAFAGSNDSVLIHLRLAGAIRESANLKELNDENLNGSVMVTFEKPNKYLFSLGYTLNKTKDNNILSNRHYYNSIILPDYGGQSFSLDFIKLWENKWGVNFNFAIGNDTWVFDTTRIAASPFHFKLQFLYHPFSAYKLQGDNRFNLRFNVGLSYRGITNEIIDYNDFLSSKFGLTKNNFFGFEGSVNFTFNNLTLFFNPTYFPVSNKIVDFPNNGIFLIGAIVTGEALKFKLVK